MENAQYSDILQGQCSWLVCVSPLVTLVSVLWRAHWGLACQLWNNCMRWRRFVDQLVKWWKDPKSSRKLLHFSENCLSWTRQGSTSRNSSMSFSFHLASFAHVTKSTKFKSLDMTLPPLRMSTVLHYQGNASLLSMIVRSIGLRSHLLLLWFDARLGQV